MNSNMEFIRRLNEHYDKGLEDGLRRSYKPGLIFGSFRKQYQAGYEQGLRLRPRQKNKADLS